MSTLESLLLAMRTTSDSDLGAWMLERGVALADEETLSQALHDHISTVAGRYAGKVYSWEVVNEAVTDGTPAFRNSIWNNQPGNDAKGVLERFTANSEKNSEFQKSSNQNVRAPA